MKTDNSQDSIVGGHSTIRKWKYAKYLKSFAWPLLALLTLVLYNLLPYQSAFVESWYSQGLFRLYRFVWDHTFALLPFGLIYILIGAVVWYLFFPSWRLGYRSSLLSHQQSGHAKYMRTNHPKPRRTKLLSFVTRVIKLLSIGIVSFYWLWAFNYKRSDFRTTADLEQIRPSDSFVFDEYCRVTDSLVYLRSLLIAEGDTLFVQVDEGDLRDDLQAAYREMQLPFAGRVRAVKIRPHGSLLRISTAGVYLPFVGQGHIDGGLHPITHPFTMMHEMSHGYGWTGEDVCNFLALLASVNSDLPAVRYSGYFSYWRYLRGQIYQIDQKRFNTFYRSGPNDVMKDYQAIIDYSNRYPDVMPMIRDVFYDQYLKSHGIPSGLVNYSQMILLSNDWQQKYGSLSFDAL